MAIDLILVVEAARLLGVSERTCRKWADSGRIPVERTSSGTRIFTRDDVIRVARNRQQSHSEVVRTRHA